MIPVSTRRYLDVDSTVFERYGRQMDVKTTLCGYWVKNLLTQNVIQRFLNVMDARWALKQRFTLTKP